MLAGLGKEDRVMFLLVAWSLWKNRNDARFKDERCHAAEIVRRAMSLKQEVKVASLVAYDSQQLWEKPRKGWWKINFDAALFDSGSWGSVGVVIRDEEGMVVASLVQHIEQVLDVEAMEALAALRGLELAIQLGAQAIVLEGDSKLVIDSIHSGAVPVHFMGAIHHDIFSLANRLMGFEASFVGRNFNYVAHTLTREVFRVGSKVWVDCAPLSITNFVRHDLSF